MRIALIALLVTVGATDARAQRLDDLVAGPRLSHQGVLRGDRYARAMQDPPAPGHHQNHFLDRVVWSTIVGGIIGLPTVYLAMSLESSTILWAGGGAALGAIAVNTASIRGPANRCSFETRLFDALLGGIAGAGVSAAIASTMKETNREGMRAVIAGTGAVLAAPVGAALAVRHCD